MQLKGNSPPQPRVSALKMLTLYICVCIYEQSLGVCLGGLFCFSD